MNPILSWLDQMTSIWSAFVFHSVWQSTLVGAVVLGAVYLGRRWPAPLRYSLLLLALAKFAVPPLWSVSPGLFGIAGPTVKVSTPARMVSAKSPTAHQETGENVSGQAAGRTQEINLSPGLSTDLRSGTTQPFALSWKTWLMLLHVTGTGVILVWIAGQLVRLHLLAKQAEPLRNEGLVQKWAALAGRMRVKRLPRFMVVPRSHSPMAFGLIQPVILLPRTIHERLSPAEVEAILGHELAHIRRRDLWVNWLQLLLLAIWWFHPVLWLVNRSLRRIREDCCDDLVLAHGIANAPDYCAVLVRAARALASAAPGASPLGCAEKFHPLGGRVSRLMDGRIPRWPSLPATSLGGVIVLALLVLPGLQSANSPYEEIQSNDVDRFLYQVDRAGAKERAKEHSLYVSGKLTSLTVWVPNLTGRQAEVTELIRTNPAHFVAWEWSSNDTMTGLAKPKM